MCVCVCVLEGGGGGGGGGGGMITYLVCIPYKDSLTNRSVY